MLRWEGSHPTPSANSMHRNLQPNERSYSDNF
jgi:hypothetical protein